MLNTKINTALISGVKTENMEMKKFKVLNSKCYNGDAIKKKPQFLFEGKSVKCGDIISLNENSFDAHELMGRGLIAPFVETEKSKKVKKVPNEK